MSSQFTTPTVHPGEVPFGANREELVVLLRHWHLECLSIERSEFEMGMSSEYRRRTHAADRAALVEAALGTEAALAVIEQVEQELRDGPDGDVWEIHTDSPAAGRHHSRNRADEDIF